MRSGQDYGQTLPAEGFGGKDSVKENRQGCLSRLIKPLFETFLKFQKVV